MKGHLGFRCRGCQRPSAPTGLRQIGVGSAENGYSATLGWDAPDNVGGGPILGYRIDIQTDPYSDVWELAAEVNATTTTAALFWCLEGGVFRVRAINRCGLGPPAQYSEWEFAYASPCRFITESTTFTPPCNVTSVTVWCIGCGATNAGGGAAGDLAWKTWTRLPQDSWDGDFTCVVRNTPSGELAALSSVSHSGTTVRAYGLGFRGNDYGGGDGYAIGTGGGTGYPITYDGWTDSYKYGGSIGGWSGVDETGSPILLPPVSPCQRRPALDRAGLFDAVASLGMRVTEECDAEPAFGSGGVTFHVPQYGPDLRVDYTASYGGGGFDATNPGGPGCIVVKYS